MPTLLGRIEREYLLSRLAEDLPPISVQHGSSVQTLPAGSYSLRGDTIAFPGEMLPFPDRTHVRIHFLHKQTKIFFDTCLIISSRILPIPGELYRDETEPSGSVSGTLEVDIRGTRFRAGMVACFPLDSVRVNPELLLDRGSAIAQAAGKAGIDQANLIASSRLYEYLDYLRMNVSRLDGYAGRGEWFFADHEHILASVWIDRSRLEQGMTAAAVAVYENRRISVQTNLSGFIPVRTGLCVLSLDMNGAQEEDKRFLYEMVYGLRYHGKKKEFREGTP
jgi:hypothetical protein